MLLSMSDEIMLTSVIGFKVFDYRGPKSSENPPKWTNSRLFTTQTRDRTVNINEQKS